MDLINNFNFAKNIDRMKWLLTAIILNNVLFIKFYNSDI